MKLQTYWEAKTTLSGEDNALEEWKSIYDENIQYLMPNKKSAMDVLEYLQSRYPTEEEPLERIRMVVEMNALNHRPYLPDGVFDHNPPEIIVLNIKNAGGGEVLFDKQEEDFWKLAEEHRPVQGIEIIPQDEFPVPIFVGVEKRSGYVYVEGSPRLSDELFAYQGLNDKELQNVYLVAKYVKLLKQMQG
jgi:hypothetical protein